MATPPKGRYLYVPGEYVQAHRPSVIEATKSLLLDLGISFVTSKEKSTGYPAFMSGYASEAKHAKILLQRELEQTKTVAIITNEAHAALALRDIPAFHVLELLNEHIERLPKSENSGAYLHPHALNKLGIDMRTVLRILRRCSVHVPTNQKITGCCGGAIYAINNPEITKKIVARYTKRITEETIISACPYCYKSFNNVKDIVEVLN